MSVPLNTIQFEFGSDRLKPESMETLKNLGGALNESSRIRNSFGSKATPMHRAGALTMPYCRIGAQKQ